MAQTRSDEQAHPRGLDGRMRIALLGTPRGMSRRVPRRQPDAGPHRRRSYLGLSVTVTVGPARTRFNTALSWAFSGCQSSRSSDATMLRDHSEGNCSLNTRIGARWVNPSPEILGVSVNPTAPSTRPPCLLLGDSVSPWQTPTQPPAKGPQASPPPTLCAPPCPPCLRGKKSQPNNPPKPPKKLENGRISGWRSRSCR